MLPESSAPDALVRDFDEGGGCYIDFEDLRPLPPDFGSDYLWRFALDLDPDDFAKREAQITIEAREEVQRMAEANPALLLLLHDRFDTGADPDAAHFVERRRWVEHVGRALREVAWKGRLFGVRVRLDGDEHEIGPHNFERYVDSWLPDFWLDRRRRHRVAEVALAVSCLGSGVPVPPLQSGLPPRSELTTHAGVGGYSASDYAADLVSAFKTDPERYRRAGRPAFKKLRDAAGLSVEQERTVKRRVGYEGDARGFEHFVRLLFDAVGEMTPE